MKHLLLILAIFLAAPLGLGIAPLAEAADPAPSASPAPTASRVPTTAEKSHNKDLNFDDEVLEGMNKNPMDSVENLSKRDGLDNGHLYHKKANFKTEMHDSSQEAGFLP